MSAVLDLFRLDSQVAIVTGSSSGLGVAFAKALAEAGASVVLAARRHDQLNETLALLESGGGRHIAVPTDVADPVQCERLMAAAVAEFGQVDILVNNAGVGTAGPATRETPDGFRYVMDINVQGTFQMAQAFARATGERGGVIVNISSVLAFTTASLPHTSYATSKAAVVGLTRELAGQWTLRKNIRVNCLAPGYFPSEMTDQYPAGHLDTVIGTRVVAGRLGRPEELAATLVWLVSPAAGYVTGQTIVVDGGVSIT
jgi:NAD(P)-dependent dehydrogenase (short-subunit alcohol dehydrogenase family)